MYGARKIRKEKQMFVVYTIVMIVIEAIMFFENFDYKPDEKIDNQHLYRRGNDTVLAS